MLERTGEGAAAEEGREWRLHREDGDGVPETRVKAAKHVMDLLAILHYLAEVSKTVGALLEAAEVVDDGRPALLDAPELRGEKDHLVLGVLHEQREDRSPYLGGRGAALVNEAEDLRAHTCVQPGDDVCVVLDPGNVAGAGHTGDVINDSALLKHNLEQSPPLGEIGWIEAEGDGHVLVDVDARQWRDGQRLRFCPAAGLSHLSRKSSTLKITWIIFFPREKIR